MTLSRKAVYLSHVVISSAIALATGASAQDPDLRLEEMIVTSQKRVETLQDVPVSVSAITGEKLEDAGIETIEDLTAFMPNIHFTETGLSTQVRVRGIGSDNSQGFEQSVGMYVDGIYYGRPQLFRVPMMDMERAELLRGPQSILFGKNSVAGALNLSTARPTDEFEGKFALTREFELDQVEANTVISGPLAHNLNARLALRAYHEDGYVFNTYTGEYEAGNDEFAGRVSVDWTINDTWRAFAKYENSTFDVDGRAIESTRDEVLAGSTTGLTYSQVLNALSQPGFDGDFNFERAADADEFSNNTVDSAVIEVEHDLNDHTLTMVSGWLAYKYDELCDCDFTAAEILNLTLLEDFDQFSQEIRITSPIGEFVEWIGGVYYQRYDQSFSDRLDIDANSLLPRLGAIDPLLPAIAGSAVNRKFNQSSDAWSLFGQLTFNLSDHWHLTIGARYTEEEKEADKRIDITQNGSDIIIEDPVVAATYLEVFGIESNQATIEADRTTTPANWQPLVYSGHDVSGTRDESAFLPLVNLEYDINDDYKLYLTYTQGFKAGGFDPRSNSVGFFATSEPGPAESASESQRFFEFENEDADAFELGFKSRLADGRGELNVALYGTEYENLQISQFDGTVGFNVGNAKKTEVWGLEIDGRWLIMEDLIASYALSYLDFEYTDFENGNCYAGQTPDGADLSGDGQPDTCSYTGKRGVYTPEWTYNLSLEHFLPLGADLSLVSVLDWQFVDEQQVHVNLDPNGMIDSYNMLGLRLALQHESWSFALIGKNLLDEKVISYTADAPLSAGVFGTSTHYSFVRKPRTLALEARFHF